MNKVFNINLGGYAFVIDHDAFDELEKYLTSLNNYFKASEGRDEIVSDIEVRIAELFKEKLKRRKIVGLKDVNEVIDTMGRPEQFEEENYANSANYTKSQFDIRTGKRLYRDPDSKILAGVCSGLSAYLGIEDPIWMRLAFVIAVFLGFGISGIAYIILWAIVPEAKTSGDKLAMQGEAANVSNIANFVQENMQHLGKKITEFSKEFK